MPTGNHYCLNSGPILNFLPNQWWSPRAWRVWNAQGAAGSLPFVVGDLPEIVEIPRVSTGQWHAFVQRLYGDEVKAAAADESGA